jgi:Ca-activated chloride channel family protein
MSFIWPELLALLLLVPGLVALYFYVLLRRKPAALRFASLALVREAMSGAVRWRRHLPAALVLGALAAALVAIARPSAMITLPSQQRTIIMAIDVSLSMRANDVQPSRLAAAQAAATAFIEELPSDLRVGLVSFAGTAHVIQKPTQNKDELIAAIERLQLDRHTAIGSGIVMSLAALFPGEDIDLETMVLGSRQSWRIHKPAQPKLERKPVQPKLERKPVQPGSNSSAAIVLLTDGRRTTGPDPLDAARMAADRGIRVFTVGFGSPAGGQAMMDGYSIYMAFDEATLKSIAQLTEAQYFHAASADELTKVYQALSAKFILAKEEREITALAAALAALLALGGDGLSLAWHNRL